MPRLSDQDRAIAIGLLQAGTPVKQVARRMVVSPKAIRKLRQKFQQTGQVKDLPRSGRPKITTVREDRLVVNRALRRRTSTGEILNIMLINFNQVLNCA
jgi:transposase-like protein